MSADFAVPGGPTSTACSPATTDEQETDDLVLAEESRLERPSDLLEPDRKRVLLRLHRRERGYHAKTSPVTAAFRPALPYFFAGAEAGFAGAEAGFAGAEAGFAMAFS